MLLTVYAEEGVNAYRAPSPQSRMAASLITISKQPKEHVHVIDPEAPQGVVCTQFASENGHTLWNPVFMVNESTAKRTVDEKRRGVRSATTNINVGSITGSTNFNNRGYDQSEINLILAAGFAGVCVSNTMINPTDSSFSKPESGSKRFKKMKDEFRMSVAVAGVVCLPYVHGLVKPSAGDLVRFTCERVGITGKDHYVPAIVKWDPTEAFKPFGVCLEKPSDTATDIRVLLRRDLSQVGYAKSG